MVCLLMLGKQAASFPVLLKRRCYHSLLWTIPGTKKWRCSTEAVQAVARLVWWTESAASLQPSVQGRACTGGLESRVPAGPTPLPGGPDIALAEWRPGLQSSGGAATPGFVLSFSTSSPKQDWGTCGVPCLPPCVPLAPSCCLCSLRMGAEDPCLLLISIALWTQGDKSTPRWLTLGTFTPGD